ncbi:MAG: cellulase family glycosylhydrolase [Planctomycetia bacterium]
MHHHLLALGVLIVIHFSALTAAAAPESVEQFGRLQIDLPADSGATAVEITAPDASVARIPVFAHQNARFTYDDRGWEDLKADGEPILAARFTPLVPGRHTWKALSADGKAIQEGAFACTPSKHPGYVQISTHDRRYFATTDGKSFCAIGLNLCKIPSFDLPAPRGEFKTSGQRGTLGIREYERWFDKLHDNGGNFTRLWCGTSYLDAQKETMGDLDLLWINRLDAVVAAARSRGIRLKLCLDTFRDIGPAGTFNRTFTDPKTGLAMTSMSEFLKSPRWRELWLKKVDQFAARYAGDPTVAVIEPWNEMNCINAPWPETLAWNAFMLAELKKRFPRQLVAESLGSYDGDWAIPHHDDMKALVEQEFDQVHRYLDQGAEYTVCQDPIAGSIDAIRKMSQPQRPVLLAETGAVNDRHTGLFRLARWDDRGIIFHDTTFPAFFAGSAGTGQEWFWDSYVDQKNLWPQYKALSEVLGEVPLDREKFRPVDLSTPTLWCLALVGEEHTLLWLRHRGDTWQASLRDRQPPAPLKDVRITLPKPGRLQRATSCWTESLETVSVEGTSLLVPTLRAGLMLRLQHGP